EGRLDAGDPRRPVGSYGRDRLVPVSVEQPPHTLRELRLRLFDVPPCRHGANGRIGHRQSPLGGQPSSVNIALIASSKPARSRRAPANGPAPTGSSWKRPGNASSPGAPSRTA